MRELTVDEINRIENGEYVIEETHQGITTQHRTNVEIKIFRQCKMATGLKGRICWWLGEFTEDDNKNWLRIYAIEETQDSFLPELKPCPFCGSPAKITGECDMVWAVCTNVDCQTERIGRFDEPEDAVKDWNERTFIP